MQFFCAILIALIALPALAQDARDLDPERNIALNKPVAYAPAPNYSLTRKGDTDGADLTDGRLTARSDQHMWFESLAVGWSYGGRVNLSVDLGSVQPIDEVAIRFLGGSPQPGVAMPGWVEVLVSDGPDEPYYKVAEYSKWTDGDREKFGIPRCKGKAWVHRLQFTELKTRGRLVGLRFYGAGLTCADEMYVFKGDHDPGAIGHDMEGITDFTITGAALHFHKPAVFTSEQIATPLPMGCNFGPSDVEFPLSFRIEMPPGVNILAGGIAGVSFEDMTDVKLPGGGHAYTWSATSKSASNKVIGRLYVKGRPAEGEPSQLKYQTTWGDYESPVVSHPIKVVDIPEQPVIPRRLMTSMSWGGAGMAMGWPDWDQAFRHIGFNTVTPSGTWFKLEDTDLIEFCEHARELGYKIQMIDSTWHQMMSRCKDKPEIYAQFEDGTHGTRMCPSYRGPCYEEELRRVATAARTLKPNYIDCDIELWNWQGPLDVKKCIRCQADKAASGIEDWGEWQLSKGEEMWIDLYEAVQAALKEAGAPPCEMSVYDFRPGRVYQFFWPFDRLYPKYMATGQVSTYTPLDPCHIEMIGNDVREDREKLPRSDQMPWLTPGDAGTFPGDAFCWAILECFCNGSRGINFWSNRVWDADDLAGYAKAIRMIAPVEDIIVDGELLECEVEGPGRVSAVRSDGGIVMLVSDYHGDTDGKVSINLKFEKDMEVVDLETGSAVDAPRVGMPGLVVNLEGKRARLLLLR